jgi:hypothetical protein
MAAAGDFPRTVMVRSFTEAAADSLGHRSRTYTDVRKCAARLWQRSAAQVDNAPAEFPATALRLLLRLPPKTIAINWQLREGETTYQISDLEWRDDEQNCLVTLEKV